MGRFTTPEETPEAGPDADALLAAIAQTVPAEGDQVPSPCISVCRINAATGLCDGCYRSLREISGWAWSGPAAQRLLWSEIGRRMAAAQRSK